MLSYIQIRNHKRGDSGRGSPLTTLHVLLRGQAQELPLPPSAERQTKHKLNFSSWSYTKICIQINIQMSLIPMICLLSSNPP